MYDTYVTVIGNALNTPEWRRTTNTGAVVVSFKVASTSRRMNRETGQWEDGNSLRVRVTCWRRLAEGVGHSVHVGDPVVVVGRLYTREWVDEAGTTRLAYELDAVAVGHDLSKGRARFARVKAAAGTSMVDDAEAEARVGGHLTTALAAGEVPTPPPNELDDMDLDSELSPAEWDSLLGERPFGESPSAGRGRPDEPDPVSPVGPVPDGPVGPDRPTGPDAPEPGDDEQVEEEPGRRRRRSRVPVPA